jgi:hypothetical protein
MPVPVPRVTALLPVLGVAALGAACSPDSALKRINESPEVAVTSPAIGEVFRLGSAPVPLLGTVSDEFDPVEELAVVWVLPDGSELPVTADASGGVSAELPIDGFELGAYEVTLIATDLNGGVATATTVWEVAGPLGAPSALITYPSDGSTFDEGESITFQGEGSDETTPVAQLDFSWSSSVDGPLSGEISADGSSVLITDALSAGEHVITLAVTDVDLEVGTDSITITIGDDGGEDDPITEPVDAEEGDLVFTEMQVNPEAVEDHLGEWVELYNTSDYPIDISGYSFRDDDIDEWIMDGVIIPPKSYAVLCADMSPTRNGGVPCDGWFLRDWEGEGLALANGPDELVLSRPDGVEIDWLHYTDDWFTPTFATGVDPDYVEGGANDDGAHWCDMTTKLAGMVETGTPGMENDHCD